MSEPDLDWSENPFAEAARAYSRIGWAVNRADGKRPKGKAWETTKPLDPDFAAGLWANGQDNIGVVCGPSGLAILDIDISENPEGALLDLLEADELPLTPICRTGSGRLQAYFADPGGLTKVAYQHDRGQIELRVGPHFCVAPPSIHPDTGRAYIWLVGHHFTVPLLALPDSAIKHLGSLDGRVGQAQVTPGEPVKKGGRHDRLLRAGGAMCRQGFSYTAIENALLAENETFLPPLDRAEVIGTARDLHGRYPPKVEEIPGQDHPSDENRWPRIDLADYINLPAEEPEIGGLFYAGRRHLISGPGEAMKTWLCLAAAVAEIKAGRGVIWADLDGMGARDIAKRLVAFGVTEEEIQNLVYFTNPEGPLGEKEFSALLDWARSTDCRLLVTDAFTGFLVAHGLDGEKGIDVEKAWTRLDPFLEVGIAVVLIDHVVKNVSARKGQAIGSERKGTAAHLHFDLISKEKLARGGRGRSLIGVTRDRGAHFPRPLAGELHVFSNPETGAISWRIEPPRAEGEPFRPTGYMEKVSRFVEMTPGASKDAIESSGLGKAEHVRTALNALVSEEFVNREIGPKGAHLHYSLKPFREADDVVVPSSSPDGTT